MASKDTARQVAEGFGIPAKSLQTVGGCFVQPASAGGERGAAAGFDVVVLTKPTTGGSAGGDDVGRKRVEAGGVFDDRKHTRIELFEALTLIVGVFADFDKWLGDAAHLIAGRCDANPHIPIIDATEIRIEETDLV